MLSNIIRPVFRLFASVVQKLPIATRREVLNPKEGSCHSKRSYREDVNGIDVKDFSDPPLYNHKKCPQVLVTGVPGSQPSTPIEMLSHTVGSQKSIHPTVAEVEVIDIQDSDELRPNNVSNWSSHTTPPTILGADYSSYGTNDIHKPLESNTGPLINFGTVSNHTDECVSLDPIF
jgi:hypothetical protein